MDTKKRIINSLISLRKEKILPLSKKTGINRGNLSLWLKDAKNGYLSKEKIHILSQALGYDEQNGKLLAGIHRWFVDISVERFTLSEVLNSISPTGGKIIPAKICIYPSHSLGKDFVVGVFKYYWVIIPNDRSIRIIIFLGEYTEDHDFSEFYNPIIEYEYVLNSWKSSEDLLFDFSQVKVTGISEKLESESLSVSELDKILFDSPSYKKELLPLGNLRLTEEEKTYGWTWDRLVSALKAQGKVPEEVAEELGLVDRETK